MSSVREPRWQVELDDINRLRRFAFRHRLSDSVITVARLLDIAEEAERRGMLGEHAVIKVADA